MEIYQVKFHDAREGLVLSWHSSKDDAERALLDMQRAARTAGDPPQGTEVVDQVEIPTDRAGLIGWLNTNFIRGILGDND